MQPPNQDPFKGVRSISAPLIVLLALRASMRLVGYVASSTIRPVDAHPLDSDLWVTVESALLGFEGLLSLLVTIFVFVWLYRVHSAARASGEQTTLSPGMAVGGWFIPFANAVLPWLAVRGTLQGVRRSTAIAGFWWVAWLIGTGLGFAHSLYRQLALSPEVLYKVLDELSVGQENSLMSTLASTYWPYFIADTAAFGLLAIIVVLVRKASPDPARV